MYIISFFSFKDCKKAKFTDAPDKVNEDVDQPEEICEDFVSSLHLRIGNDLLVWWLLEDLQGHHSV